MEVIKNYLENMFCNLPHTKEIERLKNDLLFNMEEKYQELKNAGKLENEAIGIVISEFGNIDELLEEMDIKGADVVANDRDYPIVSLEQAREFIDLKGKISYFIASGASLLFLGVALMIFLIQRIDEKSIFQAASENVQGVIPVTLLFLFIVPAVGLFIYGGNRLEQFKYIEEGHFNLAVTAKVLLNKELPAIARKQSLGTVVGVCLCVLSPVAILTATFFDKSLYGLSILLLMIATAVFIFITSSSVPEAYKMVLELEAFNPERKKQNKVIGAVAGIVWPTAVCIFLFCGFVFNLWRICWIIFPITGILFGGFSAFYIILKSN
jgi:hypothetical protein